MLCSSVWWQTLRSRGMRQHFQGMTRNRWSSETWTPNQGSVSLRPHCLGVWPFKVACSLRISDLLASFHLSPTGFTRLMFWSVLGRWKEKVVSVRRNIISLWVNIKAKQGSFKSLISLEPAVILFFLISFENPVTLGGGKDNYSFSADPGLTSCNVEGEGKATCNSSANCQGPLAFGSLLNLGLLRSIKMLFDNQDLYITLFHLRTSS